MTNYQTPPGYEIDEHIARFKNVPAARILYDLGALRDFLYENMTPQGRKFFEKNRFEKAVEREYRKAR